MICTRLPRRASPPKLPAILSFMVSSRVLTLSGSRNSLFMNCSSTSFILYLGMAMKASFCGMRCTTLAMTSGDSSWRMSIRSSTLSLVTNLSSGIFSPESKLSTDAPPPPPVRLSAPVMVDSPPSSEAPPSFFSAGAAVFMAAATAVRFSLKRFRKPRKGR